MLPQGRSRCVRGLPEREGFPGERHGLVELAESGERESRIHASLRTAPVPARRAEQVDDGDGLAAQRQGAEGVAGGLIYAGRDLEIAEVRFAGIAAERLL